MIINPVIEPRIIEDYDIVLVGGVLFPITLDRTAGDTMEEAFPVIKIHLAAKPSPTDPEKKTQPEDHTIFLSQVLYISRRTREVMPVTPEQQELLKAVLHKLHPTVQ